MSKKGYTYPGYNYLGPGNDIYNEENVVDSTDFIAYVHDLEYTLANSEVNIKEADRKAIASFVSDFRENGRVSDLAGIIGLGIKYGVESVFGVQYPNMSKQKLTFSQYIFGLREKHLSEVYRERKNQFVNYNAFKQSDIAKQLYEAYRKGGQYYKHYLAEWQASNNAIHREEVAEEDNINQPGPSKRPADTGSADDNPSKQFRPESAVEGTDTGEISPPLTPGSARVLEGLVGHIDTGDISEAARRASADVQAVVPMDTTEISASGSSRGPNTGARSGPSGLHSNGGAASTVPNITWIRPSEPAPKTTVTFKKSRILISYGYSTENIQLGDPDYVENITTSLALIPVDFLPFYLSHAEFAALPFGATVKEVSCSVTPLGTRTAFDTGTTLSGTATSEYVPIGLICEGLNKQFYGRNKEYVVDATNPMKPTSVKSINAAEIAKKYYVRISSNALCVPQSIDQYYVHEWNRSSNPDAHALPKYMIHDYGVARMDEKVHQFLINPAIGQEIVHYTYKPKNGLIKSAKDHFVPWNRNSNAVETTYCRPRSMMLQFFSDSTGKPVIGDVGLGQDKNQYTLINQCAEQYVKKIENYGARGATSFEAQPQLHIGLVATPQLNPATAHVSYLNSACYWKVECQCQIQFDVNSAFSKNNAISWPLEVTFIENATQSYTDGQTLFGNTDTKSGNVTATISDNEDDDDFEIIQQSANKLKL